MDPVQIMRDRAQRREDAVQALVARLKTLPAIIAVLQEADTDLQGLLNTIHEVDEEGMESFGQLGGSIKYVVGESRRQLVRLLHDSENTSLKALQGRIDTWMTR